MYVKNILNYFNSMNIQFIYPFYVNGQLELFYSNTKNNVTKNFRRLGSNPAWTVQLSEIQMPYSRAMYARHTSWQT